MIRIKSPTDILAARFGLDLLGQRHDCDYENTGCFSKLLYARTDAICRIGARTINIRPPS